MSTERKRTVTAGLNSWRGWLLVLAIVAVVATAAVGGYVYQWLHSPLGLPADGKRYDLQTGETLGHLTARLGEDQVLEHPRVLRLYARLAGATQVQAGEYQLPEGATPLQLLDMLNRGQVVLHQVTIVEGWTYGQALEALHARDNIRPLLQEKNLEQQLALLDLDLKHPEGWFFPDSYHYASGTSDVEILRRAHRKMRELLDQLWRERAENLPYAGPYEALIMASIVERETGARWEREDIAGVFVRRLEQGMRLQTDPTVIYGMGSDYQGKIGRRDLLTPTDYNTYTISGLPPTPIALPGRGALSAALNPAPGEALYFVARGDGTHVFSETLEEHNKAVRQYQLQRRKDYRSAPPAAETPAESE